MILGPIAYTFMVITLMFLPHIPRNRGERLPEDD
jgi:hypothetical protein